MKTLVKFIGVTDKKNIVHAVPFTRGVNVVTGRSSTGKSALLEIFDYCFGNSDYTVPEGVITDNTNIYFVLMQIDSAWIVLARRENDTKHAFIKMEDDEEVISNSSSFTSEYFKEEYFLPLPDFKKTLRKHFGSNIQITDIEENQEDRTFRKYNRKSPTPSIRSFTSFMLQHQNLLANKHAIFYRFDEKEKREQVIDHFKVFAGFADQDYFLKVQELESLKLEERKLFFQIPKQADVQVRKKMLISDALKEYSAVSALPLDASNAMTENKIERLSVVEFEKYRPLFFKMFSDYFSVAQSVGILSESEKLELQSREKIVLEKSIEKRDFIKQS